MCLASTASAQSGFIQVGPGTTRPTCASITAPVTNQTWCAEGISPYAWKVWNGSAFVPLFSPAGNPAAPPGSTQFNNAGTSFGGSSAPLHAGGFATLQAAITAAPAGSIVQAECRTYNENIVINKALSLEGCFSGEGAFGTVINGGSGTAITISQTVYGTGFGYALRNIKTTGTGVGIHLFQTVAAKLEYVQTNGHTTAVLAEASPVMTIINSQFQNYTACGVCISNTVATDNGDNHIAYNQFSAANPGPVAKSIGWTSGSGLYITNNKFLGPVTTIIDINNDQTAATDFIIANNNVEHGVAGGYALRVRNNGSAGFTNVAVTGNQFTTARYTNGVSIEGVTNAIDGVQITGNGFGDMPPGVATTYINLIKTTTFSITGNAIIGPATGGGVATGIKIDSTSGAGSVSGNVTSQLVTRFNNASANQVTIFDNANGDVQFFGLTSNPPAFTTVGGHFTIADLAGVGSDSVSVNSSGRLIRGGGGGGGGPAGIIGATQYNASGVFGGVAAPVQVAAYGTTRAAIQNAINAAPDGSLLQFDCVAYNLDGTTITNVVSGVRKNLTFQGCTSAPIGTPGPFSPSVTPGPAFGTVFNGVAAESLFTITVDSSTLMRGTMFRDVNMNLGTGGTGITFATSSTVAAGLTVKNVAINGGANGIVGSPVRGVTIQDSQFTNQTARAISLVGFNCDDGGLNIAGNNILGAPGTEAIYLEQIAALVMQGNFALFWNTSLHVNVKNCGTAGPTQFTIYGNQLETAGAGTGHNVWFEATTVGPTNSGGNIAITGNQLGMFGGGGGDVVRLDATGANHFFNLTVNDNTMGATVAGFGCVYASNILGGNIANNACAIGDVSSYIVKVVGDGYGVQVVENSMVNPVPGLAAYQGFGPAYTLVTHYHRGNTSGTALADLPAVIDGSTAWCDDCQVTSPCTGGGAGTQAERRAGVWECTAPGIGAVGVDQVAYGTGSSIIGSTDFTFNQPRSEVQMFSPSLSVTNAPNVRAIFSAGSDGTLDGTSGQILSSTFLDATATSVTPTGGDTTRLLIGVGSATVGRASGIIALGNDTATVTNTDDAMAMVSFHPALTDSLRAAIIGTVNATITKADSSSIMAANTATITNTGAFSVGNSAIVGGSGGVIDGAGSNVGNNLVLGGTNGSVTGVSGGVSINGGVVTTSNTTAVGGTIFNVDQGSNTVSGAIGAAVVMGALNVVTGANSFIAGQSNNDAGINSILIGGANVNTGSGFLFGLTNHNTGGSDNTLVGENNTVTGSDVDAFGEGNTIGSSTLTVTGQAITIPVGDCTLGCSVHGHTIDLTGLALSHASILSNSGLTGSGSYVVSQPTVLSMGVTAFATAPELKITSGALDFLTGANAQTERHGVQTELTTIAAAATTDTTFTIPANCRVDTVTTRVTTVIPTAATYSVGTDTGGSATYYGSGISTAATTTSASAGTTTPLVTAATTKIRITPNTPPAANTGRVRITATYTCGVPPTS